MPYVPGASTHPYAIQAQFLTWTPPPRAPPPQVRKLNSYSLVALFARGKALFFDFVSAPAAARARAPACLPALAAPQTDRAMAAAATNDDWHGGKSLPANPNQEPSTP